LYVVDFNGHRIRSVSLTAPHAVGTIAGTGTLGHADGPAGSAQFHNPDHIFTDGHDLYITEYVGNRLRRLNLQKMRVSTVAGSGTSSDVPGVGALASLNGPVGVVSDGRRLFVATYNGNRLFRIVDDGLLGYWPVDPGVNANEYSSDNSASLNGSFVGGPLSTMSDRFGNDSRASLFNGGQRVSAAATGLPTGTIPRSICSWVRPTAHPTGNAIIASFGTATADGSFGIYLIQSAAGNRLGITTFGGGTDMISDQGIALNLWSHVCATSKGSGVHTIRRLYLNGKLLRQDNTSASIGADGAVTIGGQQGNFDFFTGGIADVLIYGRALDDGEIHALAQSAASTEVGASYSNAPVGLLAHYEFNSNAQTTPSGPVGQLLSASGSGPIGVHGDAAGAFYFDGNTSNSASAPGLPTGSAPRTLCIWIKPQQVLANRGLIAHGAATTNQGFGLSIETTGFSMWSYGNTKSFFNHTYKLNAWQHVCGAFDGTLSKVYVDGVLVGTAAIPGTVATAGSAITIGSGLLPATEIFQGTLDDVRIYDHELSAFEIRQLATLVPTGLVFRMDSLGDATDVSGFGAQLVSNAGTPATGRDGSAGSAYAFNSGQAATYAHSDVLMGQQDMSWTFWLKARNMTDLATEIFSKYQPTPAAGWVLKYDQSNYIHGWTMGTSATATIGRGSRINSNNVWNHIAFVRSGANMTVYQNGASIIVYQAGDTSQISQNTVNMRLGSLFTGDLLLQDVRVYSRALTLNEIQTLSGYHVQQTNAGLRLHLQADTFSDLSDGTLISTNWLDSAPIPYNSNAFGTVNGSPRYVSGTNSLLGGKPAVEFDGTDGKYFSFGAGDSISYSGLTVCGAITRKGTGFRGLIEKRDMVYSPNNWGMLGDTTVNVMKFEVDSDNAATVSATINDDTPAAFCAISTAASGGQLQGYLNGFLASSISKVALSGAHADPLVVGTRYVLNNGHHGQVGDLIFMTKDASSTELLVTNCYLSAKYRIALHSSAICP
jgi:hypothetical protein